jgi:hypothetical protein
MMRARIVLLAQGLFVLLFVAVAVSNFQLRRQLVSMRSVGPTRSFHTGDLLPKFEARDAANRLVDLGGRSQASTVMVLFAPGCDACEAVLDQIAARPAQQVTAVSLLPKQRSELESRKVAGKVPVYFVDHIQRSSIARQAHAVPQILRIGAGGRIEEVCSSYSDCVQSSGS